MTKATKITTVLLTSSILLGGLSGLLAKNNLDTNGQVVKNNEPVLHAVVVPDTVSHSLYFRDSYNDEINAVSHSKEITLQVYELRAGEPTTYTLEQDKLATDITPNAFIEHLTENGAINADGATAYKLSAENLEWFKSFGHFTSVIENSTWWIKATIDETAGTLGYVLSADIIYGQDGIETGSLNDDYTLSKEVANGTMNLARADYIPPVTIITAKPNCPIILYPDPFIESSKNADGSYNLEFLSQYINGLDTIPTLAKIILFDWAGTSPRDIEWKIVVSGWWDGASPTMQAERDFYFVTSKLVKNETIITTKIGSPVVKNETTFIESVKNADNTWNLDELSKYVDGLDTLPSGETVNDVVFVKSEGIKLFFELTVSGWHDGIDNPIQPPKTFNFEVNLFPVETTITTKADSPAVESETAFIESVKNADGSWNSTELSKYVDGIITLPESATILDVIFEKESDNGTYEFKVKVSGWYNGTDDTIQPEREYNFTVKNKDYVAPSQANETDNQFPWWWIIVGIGGVSIIILATWLIVKKVKANKISQDE